MLKVASDTGNHRALKGREKKDNGRKSGKN